MVTLSPPLFYPHRSEYPAPFHVMWPRINNQKILDPVCYLDTMMLTIKNDFSRGFLLRPYFFLNLKMFKIHKRNGEKEGKREGGVDELYEYIHERTILPYPIHIHILIQASLNVMNTKLVTPQNVQGEWGDGKNHLEREVSRGGR